MFVHPATHHFSRTYTSQNAGHPTTGRKNLNKENAGALPSKTPSRMTGKGMVPSTSIRVGLGVKSTIKDGNVQNGNNGDGKGKGKDEDIAPKRLFTSHASSSKSTLPPSKSLSSLPAINSLPTRTPAARRQAPANLRTPAPPVFEPPTPLPSASRTRRRSRQSLTPHKADPIEFKTPARSAKWEEEVSLGSIEIGAELEEVVEVDEGDGDDEVEYMPPPMPELPPEPPFEHADLKRAFGILANVPPLWRIGEAVIEVPELEPDFEPEPDVQLLDDEMLEEPLFRIRKPDTATDAPSRSVTSKVNPGSAARNATVTSKNGAAALSAPRTTAARAPLTAAPHSRVVLKPGARMPAVTSTIPSAVAARTPPIPTARSAITRPSSRAPQTAPNSRPLPTVTRVPPTAYLAKPRPGVATPATTKPLTSRGTPAIAGTLCRAPIIRPPVNKADPSPIIKMDVPVMELEDMDPVEPDLEFDLSLGSDDEAGETPEDSSPTPEGRDQPGGLQLNSADGEPEQIEH